MTNSEKIEGIDWAALRGFASPWRRNQYIFRYLSITLCTPIMLDEAEELISDNAEEAKEAKKS